MASPTSAVSSLEKVEAILRNQAVYELADLIPKPLKESGGRQRLYPDFMLLAYEALVSVYGSARQVEAEIGHPLVWRFMRNVVRETVPDQPEKHLPKAPMRRHHYLYGRNRYLADPNVYAGLARLHRILAARQAGELGLLDPQGSGSWTRPDPDRMLHADGKVVAPLFRAKPGDTTVDRNTGEIRSLRYEPDAGLHFEGDGEAAWGTKFVLVAARTTEPRGRIILDVEWVPRPGGEAKTAMECFTRLVPLIPGAQGVVYDTALRGVHLQTLLRDLGLLPVNKVTAAEKGVTAPRRGQGRRVEKSAHIEDKVITLPDGSPRTVHLYARGGAVGIGELTETGDLTFSELPRVRTHRIRDKVGRFRWYNDYALPERYEGKTITVRLHGTPEDEARRFNRTENVRAIPPSDPDFHRLYSRRNDAESINRGLDDSMWLGRAHSEGHARQLVNLLGYALMVNGLALLEHRARSQLPEAA